MAAVCLVLTGCDLASSSVYTVNAGRESSTDEADGRNVDYRDWTATVDGKAIPIEEKASTIRIDRRAERWTSSSTECRSTTSDPIPSARLLSSVPSMD